MNTPTAIKTLWRTFVVPQEFVTTWERVSHKRRPLALSLFTAGLLLWGMDVIARANYVQFICAYSPTVSSPQRYWKGWKIYMHPCFSDYGCSVGHSVTNDQQETVLPHYMDLVETYGVLWFRAEKRQRAFTEPARGWNLQLDKSYYTRH